MVVIEIDPNSQFEKDAHDSYFLDSQEFFDLLVDRKNAEYNNACFKRVKDFITKSQASEFAKPPVFKCLYSYLAELYRKLNIRNTMSQQYNQIQEIKVSIDSNYFSINYSEHYIKEK